MLYVYCIGERYSKIISEKIVSDEGSSGKNINSSMYEHSIANSNPMPHPLFHLTQEPRMHKSVALIIKHIVALISTIDILHYVTKDWTLLT